MSTSFPVIVGDALAELRRMPEASIHCAVTSPPYWGLRDYGVDGQMGLESTPQEYAARMVALFAEVRRVLRDDGTLWLNLGDSYIASPRGKKPGNFEKSTLTNPYRNEEVAPPIDKTKRCSSQDLKTKDLVGIPWMVAFALRSDGWYLRSDIIWAKPNPMPESVTDRPTKAHEYLFLMSKSAKYFYDADVVREPSREPGRVRDDPVGGASWERRQQHGEGGVVTGATTRNLRSVWEIPTQAFPGAHFATFPEKLAEPCILAGCPAGGTVLDPFAGSGTVAVVAAKHGRSCVSIELNPEYAAMARARIARALTLFHRS